MDNADVLAEDDFLALLTALGLPVWVASRTLSTTANQQAGTVQV